MFDDYVSHDLQFGTVNIDSRWAPNFGTFVFDSKKFPTVREMSDGFRAKNIHIVLWLTSFINTDSANYNYAQERGYLFNTTIK
jgi:alpha-glucosidase (family GH31 glycosyl hydrolase)